MIRLQVALLVLTSGCKLDRPSLSIPRDSPDATGGMDAGAVGGMDASPMDAGRVDGDGSAEPSDASADVAEDAAEIRDSSLIDAGTCRIPTPEIAFDFEGSEPLTSRTTPPMTLTWEAIGGTVIGGVVTFAGGRLAFPGELPPELATRIETTNAYSVEVWIEQVNPVPTGPARIVTCSESPTERAFTLGQEGADLVARLRTNRTDRNGTDFLSDAGTPPEAELHYGPVFPALSPRHVVLTWTGRYARLFVDGELAGESDHGVGARAIIDDTDSVPRCAFGDEFGPDLEDRRQWLAGQLHFAALYVEAFDRAEVRCLRDLGAERTL